MAWFVKRGQIQRCQLRREKSPAVLYLSAVQMLRGEKDSRAWSLHSAPNFRPPHLPCLSFCIYLPLAHVLSPRLTAGISLLSLFCSSLSFLCFLLTLTSPFLPPAGWPSFHCLLPVLSVCLPYYIPESPLPGFPAPNLWLSWPLSFWTCRLKIS